LRKFTRTITRPRRKSPELKTARLFIRARAAQGSPRGNLKFGIASAAHGYHLRRHRGQKNSNDKTGLRDVLFLAKGSAMNHEWLKPTLAALFDSQKDAARVLDVTTQAIEKWGSGEKSIPRSGFLLLALMRDRGISRNVAWRAMQKAVEGRFASPPDRA
jgi:hypothetical protein